MNNNFYFYLKSKKVNFNKTPKFKKLSYQIFFPNNNKDALYWD